MKVIVALALAALAALAAAAPMNLSPKEAETVSLAQASYNNALKVSVQAHFYLTGWDSLALKECSECPEDKVVARECSITHDVECADGEVKVDPIFEEPSTGCADNKARIHTTHFTKGRTDAALCPGSFDARIGDPAAKALCAPGWKVCTGRQVYALNLPNEASAEPGDKCFAFDSAVDCQACFDTCASSTSVNGVSGCFDANTPDIPGVGGKCAPDGNAPACWHSNGPRRKARDQSNKCWINTSQHNVDGVLCCPE